MPSKLRSVRIGPVVMPAVLAGLMAALILMSIAGVSTERNGAPWLAQNDLLSAPGVWRGQIWRLVSYVLFERDPLALLFSCLTLYWFGRDLTQRWGARRFLAAFFGLAALAGLVVCLTALLWPVVALLAYSGSAPVLDGLVVAWGVLYAHREIRLWGVVRLTGTWLVWATVGGTVLFALYYGFAVYVPHFAAELLTLLWLGKIQPRRAARRRARLSQAARGEAWTFGSWYEKERRR